MRPLSTAAAAGRSAWPHRREGAYLAAGQAVGGAGFGAWWGLGEDRDDFLNVGE
jgi:hypothetical protein